MLTELLMAAAAAAAVSAQSYPKSDDPARILGAAESIDRRLRQGPSRSRKRSESESSSSPVEQVERDLFGQDRTSSLLSELSPDPRIIGGTLSTPNRYPYLVSLTYYGSHLCGGSLVARDLVLTAAHCAGYSSAVDLGRQDRNIPYNEKIHERIEVAYEIKHPSWNQNTVDNDFMVMKLVQPSTDEANTLATLNTNPSIPSIPGEQLTLMGWGDTNPDPDVNEPSLELLEVQLEYVPDAMCRKKKGEVGTDGYVSYESRITDNMLCAMDEDGGRGDVEVDEDTCLGDSGSPMIVAGLGKDGEGDVQVGIVSWGIGCASPTFPGVYSRVSSQYEWIRRTICLHSSEPPEIYDCGEISDEGGTAGPVFPMLEDDGSRSSVTLEVSLDEQPHEFSWMVSTLSGKSGQMVSAVPPGFYSGYKNYTFHHKLEVNPDQFYRISLRDSFGDGLKGYVAVYRGVPILSNLIMYERLFYDEDSTDIKRKDHAFYTGKDPLSYFSLQIRFDKFPPDLWWSLESDTDGVILAQRPPGWYNERFELMTIVETIPLFGARPDVNYRFSIGDSYPCENNPTETCGDGICCNYGNGFFKLFSGAVEDGDLLSSGGDYGLKYSVLLSSPTKSVSL